ncbi:hypothetical protein EWB00_005927 [Schistosoma japonicum]|uniref:Uncharacterized protein n=1 Tax=Schistosoma japonicum TaxID=6182 RepID=C1LHC4_SCHJA|nr:hypothetical protein KSF78_0001368 [Schistosoma japonicum]TNN09831.1 hypothetical protein EWB00_005927 [Schistosoma japonicum]CAX74101.1 hypothetical protein [Schistosoma japonicum]CAX74102.1 hypothetical protein [Schistosoma japonicum]
MKVLIVLVVILASWCSVTFGAESLQQCNKKFESSMRKCFRRWWDFKSYKDLNHLRNTCMKKESCKRKAKKCLIKELKGKEYINCPLQQTYIKSVDRMVT